MWHDGKKMEKSYFNYVTLLDICSKTSVFYIFNYAWSFIYDAQKASRTLINSLFRIGLCASYEETLRFESSIVHDPQKCDYVGSIINFVFDNADHNTCTIDGRDTFHAMGGIKCVTPSSFVKSRDINRLKKAPTADLSGKFGFYPVKNFKKGDTYSMKNVKMKLMYSKKIV